MYVEQLACIKGFLFYVAGGVLVFPIVHSVWSYRSSFREGGGLGGLAKRSLILMVVLAALIVPLRLPYLLGPGGVRNSLISVSPFSESRELFFRVGLAPALAYLLQMKGMPLYYVFSLICTFGLILLTVLFVEVHTHGGSGRAGSAPASKPSLYRGASVWILSVATSSFLMLDFQYPGNADHLSYILILLATCVPMTTWGLLAVVALSLTTFEASLLALLPLVLLAFPKKVRRSALFVVALFFLLRMVGDRFDIKAALAAKLFIGEYPPPWRFLLDHPLRALGGVFFAYKLWWVLLAVAAWMLHREGRTHTARFILAAVLLPLVVLPIAFDTSRLIGMGFLGMLLAACYLLRRYEQVPAPRGLRALMLLNIAVPSFYCGLNVVHLPGGLYKLLVYLAGTLWGAV